MKKTRCSKCNEEICNNGYEKHFKSCNGTYIKFKKSDKCIHCDKTWEELGLGIIKGDTANHARWCDKNPKRKIYEEKLSERRQFFIENCLEKRNQSIKKAWGRGCYKDVDFGANFRGKSHTDESKDKIRKKQQALDYRRLRKKTIEYRGVLLDSTWELYLAKRLDDLNIKWIRPKPIIWIDNNNDERFYYPDFYLVDYDLYLDPKNPYAFENQKEKIQKLLIQYQNIVFIKTLNECKKFEISSVKNNLFQ